MGQLTTSAQRRSLDWQGAAQALQLQVPPGREEYFFVLLQEDNFVYFLFFSLSFLFCFSQENLIADADSLCVPCCDRVRCSQLPWSWSLVNRQRLCVRCKIPGRHMLAMHRRNSYMQWTREYMAHAMERLASCKISHALTGLTASVHEADNHRKH